MDLGMPFLLETGDMDDACALACLLGLRFVELNMNFPQCARMDADALIKLKERYGLYFTVHLDESFNPFEFNDTVREAWLSAAKRTLALAASVGAPIVNMHMHKGIFITLPSERVYLYSRYSDEYRRSVIALRALCDDALRDTDTHVAVENTDGFAAHERHAVDALLESPRFGLTLDVGHSLCAGDVDMPFFMERANRLIHMHLHGASGKRCHLPLDEGDIDYAAMLRLAAFEGARAVLETKTVAALKTSAPLALKCAEAL